MPVFWYFLEYRFKAMVIQLVSLCLLRYSFSQISHRRRAIVHFFRKLTILPDHQYSIWRASWLGLWQRHKPSYFTQLFRLFLYLYFYIYFISIFLIVSFLLFGQDMANTAAFKASSSMRLNIYLQDKRCWATHNVRLYHRDVKVIIIKEPLFSHSSVFPVEEWKCSRLPAN